MQQFIYYKQLYMFRVSICPSSGVLGCIRIILLHMVSSTVKENCALVGCHNVLYVYIAGIRDRRWTYRCPKRVELFIIINKLLHQVGISRQFHI